MTPRLSILIPSIASRHQFLSRLLDVLNPQLTRQTELIVALDDGGRTIGEKRNQLLSAAAGDFLAFIDDDDLVAPCYCELILRALESDPDCVGFLMERPKDSDRRPAYGVHSIRNHRTTTQKTDTEILFLRRPTHLFPVRSSIAKSIGFPPLNAGEDGEYTERLNASGLLKSEVFIERVLYRYEYRPPSTRKENTNANPLKIPKP